MQTQKRSFGRRSLFVLAALLFAGALLGMMPWPETRRSQRMEAQELWETRPFKNYRVMVEIERMQRICFQEIEVRDHRVRAINDTCDISWLSSMTVPRLFEFSSWMERAPDCYPSSGNCPCQRLRVGRIQYDPVLGDPQEIAWQRQVQANVDHLDFWRRLWEGRTLPNCNTTARPIRIVVLSLVPLP